MQTCQKEHDFFEKNHVCPTCTQDLSDEFRTDKISSGKNKLDEMTIGYNDLLSAISDEEKRFNKWNELSTEITSSNQKIPQANFQINSIRKSIVDIEKEIKDLESGGGDKKEAFTKLETLVEEKKRTQSSVGGVQKDKDMLSVAAGLLKDNGIKTRIIKKYLPVMNKLGSISIFKAWTSMLTLLLTRTLKKQSSRDSEIISPMLLSVRERKLRIDIALLLTWRSIAKLKNSVDTNLLILDEIFDGSLDQQGGSDLGWILKKL